MTTITNLNQISQEQLKDIIESNGIIIKRTTGSYYVILCPECTKPEAHIYYNKDNRNIVCNRKNKCAYSKSLWDYIAEVKDYSSKQMTEYINKFFGYEFKDYGAKNDNSSYDYSNSHIKERKGQSIPIIVEKSDDPTKTLGEIKEEQRFFACCHEIFTEYLLSENDEQVKHSLNYLRNDRGYTNAQIKFFKLGFFPDRDKLVKLITNKGYSEAIAKELVGRHFSGVINHNQYLKTEEARNRITLSWHDIDGNIIGFTVRKHTSNSELLNPKYLNNSGLSKSQYLFNFTSDAVGKELVIVEGQFDALVGNYYFAQEDTRTEECHFVAIGGSIISDNQIDQLLNANCRKVTLLLDADDAGIKGTQESAKKLTEKGITAYIASIPKEYECKDVDELIYKYQDEKALITILKDAQIQKYEQNTNSANAITEMNNIQTNKTNQDKLHPEIEELLQKIKQDQISIEKLTERTKKVPIDYFKYSTEVHELKKKYLFNNIGRQKTKSLDYIALSNIYHDIIEYNSLLLSDKDENEPYQYKEFLQDIQNVPVGLKTGYKDLDQHITIQPASLAFIAGRPSHGKTTMMLNILRNMIISNPDKAFLFYSYEETTKEILIKIILSLIEDNEKLQSQFEANSIKGINLRAMALNNLRQNSLCIIQDKQGTHHMLSPELDKACKTVETWIRDNRLELFSVRKSAEGLSTTLIERCMSYKNQQLNQLDEVSKRTDSKKKLKPLGAVFIDYIQKLTTEGVSKSANRQVEIQKVCQTLLSTALDTRVTAPIILGAQVNRGVKSFDVFGLDSVRESGDIEQDANLVLGVWNDRAAEIDALRAKLFVLQKALEEEEITKDESDKINSKIIEVKNKIKEKEEDKRPVNLQIKVLKNRNGRNNFTCSLKGLLEVFRIEDHI